MNKETKICKTPTFEELKPYIGNKNLYCKLLADSTVAIVCREKDKDEVIVLSEFIPEEGGKLKGHIGHKIECAYYGSSCIMDITIECMDCYEVLFSVDNPDICMDEIGA